MSSLPNAHLLRKRPNLVRYILIFQTAAGPKVAATHRHAEKIIADDTIERVWLIDLQRETINGTLDFKGLNEFMEGWRKNYLNPSWAY